MTERTALVGVAHGTRNAEGQRTVRALLDAIRAARPGLDVREAYVDVQQPDLPATLDDAGSAVVVPLLLSTGFHVRVDIAEAVGAHPGTVAAPPLGPDAALADVLARRLADAGLSAEDSVVLAGAGSSDPAGAANVHATADLLSAVLARPVRVGFVSAAQPTVARAVAEARLPGRRVALASYLLVPGAFHRALAEADADLISEPLGADHVVARLALRRYDDALGTAPHQSA